MHLHGFHAPVMPTTVQLSDETHAKLLELAARRGGRGVAALVEEAVARYLAEEDEHRRRSDRARAVLGTLAEEDASAVEASIDAVRARWR